MDSTSLYFMISKTVWYDFVPVYRLYTCCATKKFSESSVKNFPNGFICKVNSDSSFVFLESGPADFLQVIVEDLKLYLRGFILNMWSLD